MNLDDVIRRLWRWRTGGGNSLVEGEIRQLCAGAREVFMRQPNLVELEAPINICGDVHGQYRDLLRIFEECCCPPGMGGMNNKYLFLGDYVDRGPHSIETACLLLAYKVRYPEHVFLLRGNHEVASVNRIYGFYDECKRRYSVRLWRVFADCFSCLPVAALVDGRILCVHGGISPHLRSIQQIRDMPRPAADVPDAGLLCDLLWSDPNQDSSGNKGGWAPNEDRGVSYTFGADVLADFLRRNDLDLLCRAHQVVEDGYQFFADRRLVTVFSAPNYCGEFDNDGAVMHVDADLVCSFRIIRSSSSSSRSRSSSRSISNKKSSSAAASSSCFTTTNTNNRNNTGRTKGGGLMRRYFY